MDKRNCSTQFFGFGAEDTKETLTQRLQAVKEIGIGQIIASYKTGGMTPAQFDATYFKALDTLVAACRRENIRFWLEDYAPFPTGSANGAYKEDANIHLNKLFVDERHMDVTGPIKNAVIRMDLLQNVVYGKAMHRFAKIDVSGRKRLAVVAYRLDDHCNPAASVLCEETAVRLDDKISGGFLKWDVPEGHWRVFVVYTTCESTGRANFMNLLSKDSVALEIKSPVIIGTAEILLPFGPLEELSYFLLPMAEKANVPVVVHLDHGLNRETCLRALELGFSSIMYDCSTDTYEDNVAKVREMVQIAHDYGATIEAELGHVGDNEGSAEGTPLSVRPEDFYTDPAMAKDFVEKTGVDALAIAAGTAHGAYKLPPKLDFERIRTIAGLIDVPLVLHGGSGLSDDDFKTAIRDGISKVNIFTDLNAAGAKAMYEKYQTGRGLTDLIPSAVDAICAATVEKMKLFDCVGRG